MKATTILLALTFSAGSAFAVDKEIQGQSPEQQSQLEIMRSCNAHAKEKELQGDERIKFMTECLAGGSSAAKSEKTATTSHSSDQSTQTHPKTESSSDWIKRYSGKKAHLTLDKYYNLVTGMTYREVVEILGGFGQEISSNYMKGVPGVIPSVRTVMFQWDGAGGANMNATFQNNNLVSKAQFGLR